MNNKKGTDMSSETGSFHEAFKFSTNFNLPLTWVIESNKKSVETPTGEVWGYKTTSILPIKNFEYDRGNNWIYYVKIIHIC